MHLAIEPGTDVALFNHLFTQTYAQGALDADFVASHTAGFTEALDAASATDICLTGLATNQLAAFLKLWLRTENRHGVLARH